MYSVKSHRRQETRDTQKRHTESSELWPNNAEDINVRDYGRAKRQVTQWKNGSAQRGIDSATCLTCWFSHQPSKSGV